VRAPLGKIQFSTDMVVEHPEMVVTVLSKMQFCPQRVVHLFEDKVFLYVGTSPMFTGLPSLARIPGYQVNIKFANGPFNTRIITDVSVTEDVKLVGDTG